MRLIHQIQRNRPALVLHLVATGLLLASGTLYLVLMHRPLAASQDDDARRSAQLSKLIRKAPGDLLTNQEAQGELQDLQKRINRVKDKIPAQADEGAFLSEVTRLADTHSIEIVDFRRGRVVDEATYSKIDLGLKCTANYENLVQFMAAIQTIPRVIGVTQVSLQSVDSRPPYSVELQLVLYFDLREETSDDRVALSMRASR